MKYLLILSYLPVIFGFFPNKFRIDTLNSYKFIKKSLSSLKSSNNPLNTINSIGDFGNNIQKFTSGLEDKGISSVIDFHIHPSEVVKGLLGQEPGPEWSFSELIEEVKKNNVEGVTIIDSGNGAIAIDAHHFPITGDIHASNLHAVKLLPGTYNTLVDFLVSHHVNFDVYKLPVSVIGPLLSSIGQGLLTVGVFIGASIFFNYLIILFTGRGPGGPSPGLPGGMPGQQGGGPFGGNMNSFWEGEPGDPPLLTRFDDVAGCDEAKFELMEVVDFLQNSKKYEDAGAKIPKGVLLEGSPGTGKTLLAKAVAGESGVPFISASGSEFIEMYVGLGAKRVRELFKQAKKMAPCVVFIDEIDAVGRQRGTGIAGGNDEREQTLNQILTNMDGFTPSEGIVVLAATNRADILDNALTRPGRFDRKVTVPLPDKEGRKAISLVHFKNKKISENVDLDELAVLTQGFSGADIANLANEAAIFQVRHNKTEIDADELYKAYEKVTIGLPSNVQVSDPNIVDLVSNHEIGHALMASIFPEFFDVRKVTINENKSGMGGYTLFTPKERYMKYATKKYMLANLMVALGGRAAEVYLYRKLKKNETDFDKYLFNDYIDLDITTGASNDLIQANKIAKNYVTTYGFGNDFRPVDDSTNSQPFIGRDLGMARDGPSEYTKIKLDEEISMLVKFGYTKALDIIDKNSDLFDELVNLIKDKRTIDGSDIKNIISKYNILYNRD